MPPPYKRLYNFATLSSYIFVSFQQIIFKPGKLANLKALFPAEKTDFPQLVHVKSRKKKKKEPWKGLIFNKTYITF